MYLWVLEEYSCWPLVRPAPEPKTGSQTLYFCISPTPFLLVLPSQERWLCLMPTSMWAHSMQNFPPRAFSSAWGIYSKRKLSVPEWREIRLLFTQKFQGTLIFKKSCVPVSPRWSLFIKRENPLFAITSWHLSVLGGEGAVSWRHTSLDSHVPTHSEMHSQTQHERDPVFLLWKKKPCR